MKLLLYIAIAVFVHVLSMYVYDNYVAKKGG